MTKKNFLPDFMTVFGYVVAAMFVVAGLYIIYSPVMAKFSIPKEFRTIFGITVIGYGVFRSVIIYQKSKQRKEYDNETDF